MREGTWSEKRFSQLLRVLSSQSNLRLLILLSGGEFSTRELARFLGKEEADISRRLRLFRELGLVASRWVRVAGKNVKYYRLSKSPIRIVIDKGDIRIIGKSEEDLYVFPVNKVLWKRPQTDFFVGREKELETLRNLAPGEMLIITGLAGAGKTYLVARFLETERIDKVFWHTMSSSDCIEGFLRRLALFLSSHGYGLLQEYFSSHLFDLETAGDIALDGLEHLGVFMVLDDYHRLEDNRITELLRKLVNKMSRARIIVISRKKPLLLASHPNIKFLRLEGLDINDSRVFIEKIIEKKISPTMLAELMATLHGHPLLLKWFGSIARERGMKTAFDLLMKGNVTEHFWWEIYSFLDVHERSIVSRIACLGGMVKKDLADLIIRNQAEEKALYDLIDNNMLYETDTHYVLLELVYTLISRHMIKAGCKGIVDRYVDSLLKTFIVEDYLEAFNTIIQIGFYDKIKELVEYRVRHITYSILDYLEPYKRILTNVLSKNVEPRIKAFILEELSVIYTSYEEIDKTKEVLYKALPYLEREGSPELLSLSYSRLVYIDNVNGLNYAKKALEIVEKVKDDVLRNMILSHIYANIARYYALNNNWEKAYEYALLELKHASLSGDPVGKAYSEFHKLLIQWVLKSDVKASEFRKLRETMELYGFRGYSMYIAMFEAFSYIIAGDLRSAELLLRKYIRMNIRFKSYPQLCELYGILYLVAFLQRKGKPYPKLRSVCFSPNNASCVALIAGIMAGDETGDDVFQLAEKRCSWLDIVSLDKVFAKHVSWKERFVDVKKKISF